MINNYETCAFKNSQSSPSWAPESTCSSWMLAFLLTKWRLHISDINTMSVLFISGHLKGIKATEAIRIIIVIIIREKFFFITIFKRYLIKAWCSENLQSWQNFQCQQMKYYGINWWNVRSQNSNLRWNWWQICHLNLSVFNS